MNSYAHNILPTTLLIGEFGDQTICEKICRLAYEFKNTAVDAALVSDHWDMGTKSSAQADFEQFGVTSWGTDLLQSNPDWQSISKFLYDCACQMISSVNTTQNTVRFSDMWVTVYPPGAYVPQHTHSNSMLSGIFYARVPKSAGNLVFHDPAAVAKSMVILDPHDFPSAVTRHTHLVKSGQMIIFPSWLPHRTEKNLSNQDRIMVSFNMNMVNPIEDLRANTWNAVSL